MMEVLGSAVGYGEDSYLVETATEQMQSLTSLDPCAHLIGVADESFSNGVAMVVDFRPLTSMLETFSAASILSADSYQKPIFAEVVACFVYIGADGYQTIAMSEILECLYALGADCFIGNTVLFEVVDGEVTSTNFNVYRANFDITIPPGSTLIIDSDNFVALLDGENVIDLHSGDWLELCRDTYDIQIQMGQAAPFEVTMIYQERYL